jgi:hypothetical protein
MAKFSGEIGFAGEQMETAPGVWTDGPMVVRPYFGDVLRDQLKFQEGEKVNSDLSIRNSISVVADAYAEEHIFAIRYIKWQGVLWVVSEVEVQRPRLLLRLGGVYTGNTS